MNTQTENALRLAQTTLRSVLASLPNTTEPNGRETRWNVEFALVHVTTVLDAVRDRRPMPASWDVSAMASIFRLELGKSFAETGCHRDPEAVRRSAVEAALSTAANKGGAR